MAGLRISVDMAGGYEPSPALQAALARVDEVLAADHGPDTAGFMYQEVQFTYQKIEWTWVDGGLLQRIVSPRDPATGQSSGIMSPRDSQSGLPH